jgi:nickel/cobalt exporter
MELLPLATALVLGSLHALEPDHLSAVTTFAVRRPHAGMAARFGLRWAMGHGGAIVALGTLLLLLRWQVPQLAGAWAERLVGVTLLGLGIWTIRGSTRLHAHPHAHGDGQLHTHVHGHHFADSHDHDHAITAIGALHGLAGTAPAVALLPLARAEWSWLAPISLVLFAVGTAAAMALYAMLAGWMARHAALRSTRLARALAASTGAVTATIGMFWLLR